MVVYNFDTISSVAKALLEHKRLGYFQVCKIVLGWFVFLCSMKSIDNPDAINALDLVAEYINDIVVRSIISIALITNFL